MGVYKEKKRWKILFAGKIPACYTMATDKEAAMVRIIHKLLKENRVSIEEFVPVGGSMDYHFDNDDADKLAKKKELLLKQLAAIDSRLGANTEEAADGSDQ
jgi:hypothetical protein